MSSKRVQALLAGAVLAALGSTAPALVVERFESADPNWIKWTGSPLDADYNYNQNYPANGISGSGTKALGWYGGGGNDKVVMNAVDYVFSDLEQTINSGDTINVSYDSKLNYDTGTLRQTSAIFRFWNADRSAWFDITTTPYTFGDNNWQTLRASGTATFAPSKLTIMVFNPHQIGGASEIFWDNFQVGTNVVQWTNSAGGSWLDAGSWNGGLPASGSSTTAWLSGNNSTSSTITNTLARTLGELEISANYQLSGVGAITMDRGTTQAPTIRVSGGTDLLAGTNPEIAVPLNLPKTTTAFINTAEKLKISGAISGVGALSVAGGGELTLTGINTNTGETIVRNNGKLRLNSAGIAVPGALTVKDSGYLYFDANNQTATTTALSVLNGVADVGTTSQSLGTITLKRGSIEGTGGTITLNSTAATVMTLDPDTADGHVLVKPNIAFAAGANGKIVKGTTASAAGIIQGNVALGSVQRELNVGASHLYDLIIDGVVSGSGGLKKTGNGVLVLTAANTYTGTTNIDAGVVQINHEDALGPVGAGNPVIVASGAAIRFALPNGTDQTYKTKNIYVSGTGNGQGALIMDSAYTGVAASAFSNFNFLGDTQIFVGDSTGTAYASFATSRMVGTSAVTLTKVGNGYLSYDDPSPNWFGKMRIKEGALMFRQYADSLGNSSLITIDNEANMQINTDGARAGYDDTQVTFNAYPVVFGGGTGSGIPWFRLSTHDANPGAGLVPVGPANHTWTGSVTLNNDTGFHIDRYSGSSHPEYANDTLTVSGAISGTGGIIKTGVGTLVLSGTGSFGKLEIQGGGTVKVTGNQTTTRLMDLGNGTFRMESGGKLKIAAGQSLPSVLGGTGAPTNLVITGTGSQLDVKDNDLIVRSGNATTLKNLVAAGRGSASSPTWNGIGIVSSTAKAFKDANSVDLLTIGVVLNSDFTSFGLSQMSTFSGTAVVGTDVLMKYTYSGDANLSGKVDGSDYQLIDTGYNGNLAARWLSGDFNYDNVINGSDYQLIDTAYGMQSGILSEGGIVGVVPEPASLGVLAVGAMGLLARRRRS